MSKKLKDRGVASVFEFLVADSHCTDTSFESARPEGAEETVKNGRAMLAPTGIVGTKTYSVGATIGRPL